MGSPKVSLPTLMTLAFSKGPTDSTGVQLCLIQAFGTYLITITFPVEANCLGSGLQCSFNGPCFKDDPDLNSPPCSQTKVRFMYNFSIRPLK